MNKRQTIYQITAVLVSALGILCAYLFIVGDGTIFKGEMEGETIKCRVLRITDVITGNVSGENEFVTVSFKAQAMNTDLRGKTLDVIQEIDKAYAFSPRQVEQDDEIEGMIIILNTVGGDVEAGLAIAELIAGMNKPTVSLVLGGGHSIGVPLAVSAKRSFIAPSATMTIHPVRTSGLVIAVPQTMNHFAKMQDRITDFVTRNSGISAKRFTELMMTTGELVTDVGNTLSGEDAVKEKLINSIGTLSEVLNSLYQMIESN